MVKPPRSTVILSRPYVVCQDYAGHRTAWLCKLASDPDRERDDSKGNSESCGHCSSIDTRRPLEEVLTDILGRLHEATGADGSAIFSIDPRTSSVQSVRLVASVGVQEERFLNWRGKLWKSPVKDVIYDEEHIHQNHVSHFRGKFHYLRQVRWFNSCIGIPIRFVGGRSELGYGLFLFHDDPGKFSEGDVMLAEATALVIGSVIRERLTIESLAEQQMLTVMGGLLTSIGHEIMSRLSILRSANRVQTAWHSLKQNPLLLQDSDFVARMEGNLKRLVAAKDGLISSWCETRWVPHLTAIWGQHRRLWPQFGPA
jgi:hypothetical protein